MRYLAVWIALLALLSVSPAKDEFQPGDFIRQHLNSIGTDQARAAVKNRLAQGTVSSQVVNGGPQVWDGQETFVSEGDRFASLLKFAPSVYRTEWFVRDGQRTSVAPVRPGRYTALSQFVMVHNEILTEGLWGGTLSTGWAVSRLEENHAHLQDRGLKKVDGRELRRVDYIPKKSSDLEIQLYFEPDTFRHVMTVYLIVQRPLIQLAERFADFRSIDNVMLPGRWTIEYTHGRMDRYEVTEEKISHNISLDPKNFDIK